MTPRCGRVLRRYEPRGWPPVLFDPVCGRPEGHNGPCRSEMGWDRVLHAGCRPALCGCGCGQVTAGYGRFRPGHQLRSAETGQWVAEQSRAA
ncbi:MAG TPA: hypothetical protein VNH17_23495 [Streptosporangiaceae bacterium]|nr:hypothetical protein [Streptosporangiaceae bacterium]